VELSYHGKFTPISALAGAESDQWFEIENPVDL